VKNFFATIFFFLFSFQAFSQCNPDTAKALSILKNRGEIVLKFHKTPELLLNKLTLMVSISKVEKDSVEAYLNPYQFYKFLELNIPFRIIENNNLKSSLQSTGSPWNWNQYPTYPEYVSMMDSFPKAYPSLCRIVNAGSTTKGHSLLFARISSDITKPKPSVMFSSTMHGDETGGFVLMIRLIEYLLKNYNNNLLVTHLIDSLDIWINPLANPDGTYAGGDNTVFGATRYNANGADLNRNFPDPVLGNHADTFDYQTETIKMMNLMNQVHFVLSANYHAGSEVVNYPWDSKPAMHPDYAWFQQISQEFADSVQFYGRFDYFTDVDPSGITDGYAWYVVYGGRQDYITFFKQGREVTIELDETKTTAESQLSNLWNYNYRSFLHYLEQAIYGIHGFVFDSLTQKPIKAKIQLVNHEDDNSFIFSDSVTGAFYRLINEGNYTVQFSAPGYSSKEFQNISVTNNKTTYLNVSLAPDNKNNIKPKTETELSLYPNPCKNYFFIRNLFGTGSLEMTDISGKVVMQNTGVGFNIEKIEIGNLKPGIYFVRLNIPEGIVFRKLFVIK